MKRQVRRIFALAILLLAPAPAHAMDPALPTKALAMEALRTNKEIPVAFPQGKPFVLSPGKPEGPDIEPLRFQITDRILIRQGKDWVPFEDGRHGPTIDLYYGATIAAGLAPYIAIEMSERSLDAQFSKLLGILQQRAGNGPARAPMKVIYLRRHVPDDPTA